MKKEGRFSPLASIAISAAFVAVLFLLTDFIGFTFETNDDFHISTIISRQVGEWCPYVSKLITIPLQKLDKITTVNVWTYMNLILIGLSAGCTTYVFCRNIQKRSLLHLIFLYPLCLTVFGIFLVTMNYTRTVFSVVVGAGAMLLFAVFGECGKTERIVLYCLGLVGVPLGVLVRDSPALLTVAFLGVITAAVLVVLLVRDHSRNGIRHCFRRGLLMLLPVALMGGAMLATEKMLTPEEQVYNKFNDARTAVVDYLKSYPNYDENVEYYESLGISRTDYEVMRGWNFSDTEVLTTEKYETFEELKTFNAIGADKLYIYTRYILSTKNYLLPLALMAFFFFLCDPKHNWLPMSVSGFALAVMVFYLKSNGRMPERVYLPAAYAAVMFAIFGSMVLKRPSVFRASERNVNSVLLLSVLLAFIVGTPLAAQVKPQTEIYEGQRDAYAYMGQQTDKTFAIYETAIREDYVFDPWQRGNIDDYDNVLNLNGWLCRLPQWKTRLENLGIENPSRALFERDNVYATFDPTIYSFLRENYGEDITASEVFHLPEEFDWMDEHFVRYTKSREAVKEAQVTSLAVEKDAENSFELRLVPITGSVASTEEGLNLYCHLTCGDQVLTYAVDCSSDGSFNAILYDVPEDAVVSEATLEFFWA